MPGRRTGLAGRTASVGQRDDQSSTKPWQRYYVDKYDKCANCGKLLYGEGFTAQIAAKPLRFCSAWCQQWYIQVRREGSAAGSCDAP